MIFLKEDLKEVFMIQLVGFIQNNWETKVYIVWDLAHIASSSKSLVWWNKLIFEGTMFTK
jgi:hypothetical protein